MRHAVTLVTALALAILAVPRIAAACSCVPPDLPSLFMQSDHVVRVQVLKVVETATSRIHTARVLKSWKGCESRGALVRLESPSSSAACGVELPVGSVWVVTGSAIGPHRIGVGMCGYVVPAPQVPASDSAFLASRLVCCRGACLCGDGSHPVQCFADPCQVTSCPEGSCVSNYCGGCTAEYWSEQGPLVCTPCESDGDCAFGQTCSDEGECRTACYGEASCTEDAYCASDNACRPDGTCIDVADCEAPGNGWAHILCVGYPTCDSGQCNWHCGAPRLR